jgi:glycosyltransferase involved in cell wall biosynthesis
MGSLPRLSVITPSFNQGKYLAHTIESVLNQEYPNVEHIIVDGMSTDETLSVLARYPHLRVVREPDRGPADAITKGFRLATGDIHSFLNSDDTYLPGALHRVAREIDPRRGRHVVMGRCQYVDEQGRPLALEHPWLPNPSSRRVLEVWKGNCIPQPATFWTGEAGQYCGPLDEREDLVFDYDFMCRLSRRHRFHSIDQVLATYRLHPCSKSCVSLPRDISKRSIQVSRRYWGSPIHPQYWLLSLSLVRTTIAAPLRVRMKRLLRQFGILHRHSPLTVMWHSFTGMHPDGGVGPRFLTDIRIGPEHRALRLEGVSVAGNRLSPKQIRVYINGERVSGHWETWGDRFFLTVPLRGISPGVHQLEVRCRSVFIPHEYGKTGDFRPLSFRLCGLELVGQSETDTSLHLPAA